jgi:hypothetical protein
MHCAENWAGSSFIPTMTTILHPAFVPTQAFLRFLDTLTPGRKVNEAALERAKVRFNDSLPAGRKIKYRERGPKWAHMH